MIDPPYERYEEEEIMVFYTYKENKKWTKGVVLRIMLAALLILAFISDYCFAAEPNQETFSSPAEAFKTMVAALKTGNANELTAIFGPDEKDILSTDHGTDKKSCGRFLKAYEEKNRVETVDENHAVLYVGKEDWSWPVPVVKVGERWQFDTKEGKEEILARRIGRNETAAVQVCLAYVDAQEEYAQTHRADELPEYAQKFVGGTGKDNGLCSNAKEGGKQSLLGPLLADASRAEDNETRLAGDAKPYHGYYYKILKKQGPDAPGGAYDYVVNGMMVGGFALVAYPAFYNSSGIMTFIVNQDGVVYQKDLGKDTGKTAEAMVAFNPDQSWKEVE
jgi:hypothetical protein